MSPQLPPIGGYPSSFDIAPSAVYVVLYACLLPFSILRIARPKTRNVVQLPVTAAILERILNLSVRLLQATGTWSSTSPGLLEYQQITLGWGWIALAQAILPFWRSLTVNATREDDETGKLVRKRLKLATYGLDGAFWIAQLLGLVGGICWKLSFYDDENATRVNPLRYSSTLFGMLLLFIFTLGVAMSRQRLKGIDTTACSYLTVLSLSLLAIPIYRLTQYPLTASSSKSLFYAFHLGPEYVITACLIAIDTRRIFGTGAWGDRHFSWRRGWYTPETKTPPPLLVRSEPRGWEWSPEGDDVEKLLPKDGEGDRSPISRPSRASFPRFSTPTFPPLPFTQHSRWRSIEEDQISTTIAPSPALIRDAHPSGCF